MQSKDPKWHKFAIGDLRKQDIPTMKTTKSAGPTKLAKLSSSATTTRIYIAGIPYKQYFQVRKLLRINIPRFQLDWIQNLSWIEKKIVEITIPEKRLTMIKTLFEKNKSSGYYILDNFDPLNPDSFNWEKETLPEDQEIILRQTLAKRLALSAATTNKASTTDELRQYAHNRGIGKSFDKLSEKSYSNDMISLGLGIPFHQFYPKPISNTISIYKY